MQTIILRDTVFSVADRGYGTTYR